MNDQEIDGLNLTHKWELGSCNGENDYESNKTIIQRCCLLPGPQILICYNDKNTLGWGNTYIEIQGKRYCDDFVGIRAIREALIAGSLQYYGINLS